MFDPGSGLALGFQSKAALQDMFEGGFSISAFWHRWYNAAVSSDDLPAGTYDAVAVRLPRAREELTMLLHLGAARLTPGGVLYLAGKNDEGIKSAGSFLKNIFTDVQVVRIKNHGRIWRACDLRTDVSLKRNVEDWESSFTIALSFGEQAWVSWPGLFAHGRIDPGTQALLSAVPWEDVKGNVLDYACGTGLIGASILDRQITAQVDFLDSDSLALRACRKNVPQGRLIWGDSLEQAAPTLYNMIISNPPFHTGVQENTQALFQLIAQAPRRLAPGGGLIFVTQRRLPAKEILEKTFGQVSILKDAGPFRVWYAKNPISR